MPEDRIELTHVFRHPWAIVARAYLGKYPHPKLSHVERVDTLERYVDEQGRLVGTRVITSSFLKFSECAGFERSLIDLKKQEITLDTENINYTSLARSLEHCHYESGQQPGTTLYTLKSTVQCSWATALFLKPLLSTVRGNFAKGTKVLESIIHSRFGIPYFASAEEFETRWKQSKTQGKKFKILKKAGKEIDTFLSATNEVIVDIIRTLEKEKYRLCRGGMDLTFKLFQRMSTDGDIIDRIKAFLISPDDKKCKVYTVLDQVLNKLKLAYAGTLELDWLDDMRTKFGLGEKVMAQVS